ncbi:MAG: AI-2E family transporter [Clostridium sp.]|nr:AI-2E family transporter [Clostridium sp.]MDU7082080.1 AI-2E family transporter [Clostridium sp.]
MKNNPNAKIIQSLLIINLVLIAVFLFSKLNFVIEPLLTILNAMFLPLVLAVFLYYLVRPLKRFFQNQNFSSGISTAISMLLIILLIVSITFYASSIIRTQGQGLISAIVDSLDNLTQKYAYIFPQLGEMFNIPDLVQSIIEYLSNSFVSISKNIFGVASSISNFVAQLILIPIIMFYILKDDKKLFGTFTSLLPSKAKSTTLKILHEIDTVLKQYITSQVMVASVIGVLMFIGYVIIGMPNALVLAMFSLITAFIPFLGVILGILPAILIALGMGLPMLVKVIVLTIVVQQLEGNVITPNITGNQLNMHPLTTILVVTTSVYFGGFFAAFLAVPIYNILKIIVKNIHEHFMLRSKIDLEAK